MKKQNLLVLCAAVVLIAAVAVMAAVLPQTRTISENAPSVMATETPASDAETKPSATEVPEAKAYLVISVQGNFYEPLPLTGEGSFTVEQGENVSNTVHVTPDSVWMEHSTCDNQDCVDQGTVSLANMETRVLSNMIICLPNQVVLELHTPESLAGVYGVNQ